MPSETGIKRRKSASRGAKRSAFLTFMNVAASLAALAYLFLSGGNAIVRFFLGIAVLVFSGSAIAAANGIKSSYGAYLIGGKWGIDFVDSLASSNRRLWIGLADWGFAVSFGILSFFMFRKHIGKRAFLLGIASVALIMLFVYPYLSVVLGFINIPQISNSACVSASAPSAQSANSAYYELAAIAAVSVVGGLCLFIIAELVLAAGSIILGIIQFLIGYAASKPDYGILTCQVPGVAPVIPGVTIPLFAGIIALAIILVVHEFSHGIQARLAKVRIKSIGLILLGIVPFGAFVEPDESKIKKLDARDQDRISIAGVAANMVTSLLFFAVVIAMLYIVFPNVSTGGVLVTSVVANSPAYGVIAPNTTILAWNGHQIRNDYDLSNAESGYAAGGYVNLTTDRGSYVIKPAAEGRIGVYVAPAQTTFAYQVADFIYAVAALSFGLNFFVAIVNLLPIPGFDGWRIYQGKIKDKRLLKALIALVIAAFVINALPWLWTL